MIQNNRRDKLKKKLGNDQYLKAKIEYLQMRQRLEGKYSPNEVSEYLILWNEMQTFRYQQNG